MDYRDLLRSIGAAEVISAASSKEGKRTGTVLRVRLASESPSDGTAVLVFHNKDLVDGIVPKANVLLSTTLQRPILVFRVPIEVTCVGIRLLSMKHDWTEVYFDVNHNDPSVSYIPMPLGRIEDGFAGKGMA